MDVERIKENIRVVLKDYKNPVVAWSSGKDSMVLLHILRSMELHFPVVCYREPWMPEKQAFTNRMIAEWNLTAWDYPPMKVGLRSGNGRLDVMNYYAIGQQCMILMRGTERPEIDQPYLCGVDTFLSRPLGTMNFQWDIMLHGHKSCDVDPTTGKMPLETDVLSTPGCASLFFPLRDVSDAEIFDYTYRKSVPYDETRYTVYYDKATDVVAYRILHDKTRNPDYYATCLKCCDPDSGEFVVCPKTGLQINNISKHLHWVKPEMSYCGLREEPVGV